jgi:protein SCO1/2
MEAQMVKRLFQILTGVLLGLALALWVWGRPGLLPSPAAETSGNFLPSPFPAPRFDLLSHTGARVSSRDFPGKVLVVFFGYTSCPDVCPLTLSKLARALEEMAENAVRVQIIMVTVDPRRDTPRRLREYLGNFDPSFLGLTGTEAEIREVADGFGASFAPAPAEGAEYTVDHSARTFVVDSQGYVPLTFPATASAEEVARDLNRLLGREP